MRIAGVYASAFLFLSLPDIYNKVGVYEGAGYTKKGIYRPVTECRMKINEAPAFCPVCQRALERLINFYTEK